MFHACVRKFDMMNTVGKFLETKQNLGYATFPKALNKHLDHSINRHAGDSSLVSMGKKMLSLIR